ncbi:MAG: hypothetical protein JWR26_2927 [Pedosphaera sp.]|jgi:hypothetical protein|nr:hypothetical protein [Pedosphaera sp.]
MNKINLSKLLSVILVTLLLASCAHTPGAVSEEATSTDPYKGWVSIATVGDGEHFLEIIKLFNDCLEAKGIQFTYIGSVVGDVMVKKADAANAIKALRACPGLARPFVVIGEMSEPNKVHKQVDQ